MRWNWEQPDWPQFTWDPGRLRAAEDLFLTGGGLLMGVAHHLSDENQTHLAVEEMVVEALTTSQIEGEYLNRASVQSSVRRQLGLITDARKVAPAEQGIAQLIVDLSRTVAEPLSQTTLFRWHQMVTSGRTDLNDIGRFRTSPEPMQVVSGPSYAPTVHFEAPPASHVPAEMKVFVEWFNRTSPAGPAPLTPLTRAGLAHLWFESIHPFEDGNGRIGRAVAEKALIQAFPPSTLIALGATILARQSHYYSALEAANKHNQVSDWLAWFAAIAIEAQRRTTAQVEFLIDKTRLLDRLSDKLNPRQQKALLRMLDEGPQGFQGGMSASKYITITAASPATATRDLGELVDLGAMTRSGELRSTRYTLNLPSRTVKPVHIDSLGRIMQP